jgi:hypothetical protein
MSGNNGDKSLSTLICSLPNDAMQIEFLKLTAAISPIFLLNGHFQYELHVNRFKEVSLYLLVVKALVRVRVALILFNAKQSLFVVFKGLVHCFI